MAEFPFPDSPIVADPVIAPGTSAAAARTTANDAWERDRAGIEELAANYQVLNATFLGAGRFVSDTIDPATEPQVGTGLTLRLPNGTYLIEGRAVVLSEPEPEDYTVITDILNNKPLGVEVFVGFNATTGVLETRDEWQFDTFPTGAGLLAVAGLLHLGRAVTNLTSVTSIEASELRGFGIIPNLTALATTGGGGGGGSAYWNTLARTAIDPTTIAAYIASLMDTLRSDLLDIIAAGGVTRVDREYKYLIHESGATQVGLAEVNPGFTNRAESTTVLPGIVGNGEGGGVDDLNAGTATVDESDGTVGP